MAISESMLPEFDQEMANTRKTLERVPEEKFGWKPHEKSPTMGWLAAHIAMLPGWAETTLKEESFDFAPVGSEPFRMPEPKTRQELLESFDKGTAGARAALQEISDEQMMQQWSLLQAGTPIFTIPRVAVMRSMIMNHLIHHRAQLTVYLRLNDIPVPGLYGPSADEGAMAAAES